MITKHKIESFLQGILDHLQMALQIRRNRDVTSYDETITVSPCVSKIHQFLIHIACTVEVYISRPSYSHVV